MGSSTEISSTKKKSVGGTTDLQVRVHGINLLIAVHGNSLLVFWMRSYINYCVSTIVSLYFFLIFGYIVFGFVYGVKFFVR